MNPPEWNPYAAPPPAPPSPGWAWPPPPPPRRWGVWAAVVAAALVVCVTAALLVVLFRHSTHAIEKAHPDAGATEPAGLGPNDGLSSSPTTQPPGPPVITVEGAAKVLHAYWPVHEGALAAGNLHALATLATGTAASWEHGAVGCGCYSITKPRPLLNAAYFVPRQTRYPAFFVAEAQTEYGSPWVELLVFTKRRAADRWLVTEDSGFGPMPGHEARLFAPLVGPGGFNVSIDDAIAPDQRDRALEAAPKLAALWQQATNTGQVPATTRFDLHGDSLTRVKKIASHRQDALQSTGLFAHYSFYVSPSDPLFEVTGQYGDEFACQPIREKATYTPRPGEVILQDKQQDNWGALLAPGTYPKIIEEDVWETCFLVPEDPHSPATILDQSIGGGVPHP